MRCDWCGRAAFVAVYGVTHCQACWRARREVRPEWVLCHYCKDRAVVMLPDGDVPVCPAHYLEAASCRSVDSGCAARSATPGNLEPECIGGGVTQTAEEAVRALLVELGIEHG